MSKYIMPELDLKLFDGGAAAGAGAGAAASGGEGTGNTGDIQAAPASTRRGKSGEFSNVVFGKQPQTAPGAAAEGQTGQAEGQTAPSDAGEGKQGVQVTSNTLEDKRKSFRDLVNGEYKDIYTEETQRIINRRFQETKQLQEQVGQYQPVIDMLMQRYKIDGADIGKLTKALESDNAYWEAAADEAGMSVEHYKYLQKLQRDNDALRRQQAQALGQQRAQQQMQKWTGEAEALKAVYPSFSLETEAQNPRFLAMLRAGVPVQSAYEVVHMDEIKAGVAAMQARATEKQVVDGIRAKGSRPQENGTAGQSGFTVKDDVSKLTKKDRAEIARRVARGEKISF